MATERKSAVVPKLRFPEFRKSEGWTHRKLNELLLEQKERNRDLKYGPEEVLSVSGEYGCVNQIRLLGRSYAGASVDNYRVVETGDIVYTKSPLKKNPFGIIKENKGEPGIVSTLYAVYRAREHGNPAFLDHYFSGDYNLNSYLQPIVRKGAKNDMKVNNGAVLEGEIFAPGVDEQQKVADCLTSLDEVIAAQGRKVEALKAHKRGLMQQLFPREGETVPRLRFSEFRDGPEWREVPVGELIDTITPPRKLQTALYAKNGRYPIIDQSPSEVCGWTDDADAVFTPTLPVIIFGDHTCTLKLMGQPFAQGADGIKILMPRPDVTSELLFQALQANPLESVEYKRHFSDLKEKNVRLPRRETGEQEKVASTLSSLDTQITAESNQLAALKTHKQGLMQQLFPAPEGG